MRRFTQDLTNQLPGLAREFAVLLLGQHLGALQPQLGRALDGQGLLQGLVGGIELPPGTLHPGQQGPALDLLGVLRQLVAQALGHGVELLGGDGRIGFHGLRRHHGHGVTQHQIPAQHQHRHERQQAPRQAAACPLLGPRQGVRRGVTALSGLVGLDVGHEAHFQFGLGLRKARVVEFTGLALLLEVGELFFEHLHQGGLNGLFVLTMQAGGLSGSPRELPPQHRHHRRDHHQGPSQKNL